MKLKRLIIPVIGVALLTNVTTEFNASEITSEQSTDVVYAPTHPTSEEIDSTAATDLVTIPDANLEQELADELDVAVGEITVGDMESLTSIDLSFREINDITGLEYATSLTYLELEVNEISDISPLTELTSLTYLNLASNEISDINPLAGLTNLTHLNLAVNEISDINPLAGLTNLTFLDLLFNRISDISPLAELTSLTYLNAHGQYIKLNDIIVENNNELFYDVTDIDGAEHQVSLGIPQNGTFDMSGDWTIYTSIGSVSDTGFEGTVYQNVTYDSPSSLAGNTNSTTNEEKTLTDEEYISLFEVSSSDDLIITVNQSAVDYSTPGDYDVVFSDTDGNEFVGILTVTDVLPVLNIDNNTVTISIDSTIDDILIQLEYSATEITYGDLTTSITIDDSAVDYSTPGNYEVTFTVKDEEGNKVSKTVTVVIEDDSTEVVEPETPDETTNEDTTDETTSEDATSETTSEEATDEANPMSLATTGGKSIGTLIALLAIVIVALGLKRFIKE